MIEDTFIIWSNFFMKNFSYLGIFIISMIGTSTIFLPFPSYFIIVLAATIGLNPLLVGISAGLGSAVGELTGYFIGVGGEKIIEQRRKEPKIVKRFVRLFKKHGFPIIVVAAAIPFPFDVIGIVCGMSSYDIKKFLIATAIGKIIKCLAIAYAGFLGISFIAHIIGTM